MLDSCSTERAPLGRQIVTRANQSIGEFGSIFQALGTAGGTDHDTIRASMDACAASTAGQMEPALELDAELHYRPTTFPGAVLPHVWLFDAAGKRHSTPDLCGHGHFALFTGIGGEGWVDAAKFWSAPITPSFSGVRRCPTAPPPTCAAF